MWTLRAVAVAALVVVGAEAFSLPRVSAWVKASPAISSEAEIHYMEDVTTLPELLWKFYYTAAAADDTAAASSAASERVVVAPNLTGLTPELSADLSSVLRTADPSTFRGLYHGAEGGEDVAPFASLHGGAAVGGEAGAWAGGDGEALSETAAMDKVFLWLQRQLLGFDDDTESDFVRLGRKLLTVGRHVVTDAASEGALAAVFWEQASTMQRDAQAAPAGGDDDGVSVLVAAPAMAGHPDFMGWFGRRLGGPLERLSSVASIGGGALVAEAWVGGGLDFPVILLSPPLADIEEPEGGYKIYTTADGEISAEDYIARIEAENQAQFGMEL